MDPCEFQRKWPQATMCSDPAWPEKKRNKYDLKCLENNQGTRWGGKSTEKILAADDIKYFLNRDMIVQGDLRVPAMLHLTSILTRKLSKYVHAMCSIRKTSLSWVRIMPILSFRPQHLLGYLWLQFAFEVDQHIEIRSCAYCGRSITVGTRTRNQKARYCQGSNCRVYAYRQRQKNLSPQIAISKSNLRTQ